jgi:hypothetical protein
VFSCKLRYCRCTSPEKTSAVRSPSKPWRSKFIFL